ncbi:tRNA (adenosine(37)-N6)-threonylcarbamoyltransferase complex ATPase subunit type 1 TsaE [Nesterenkonia sphaerica]|uniref:tRNA (adenosine(37)-N6)-threonylcarbamoyltransferase complex ATPase subunit type 1 TsaE n=1 Tax=Nesterenkonia sphaerica TaxID=1804988 RepID=UPI001FB7BC65|nr:tRNA (adenosine(37)-N6)-threonylcarbamoyltransferase complex ATPase subunit type 1 TsaE [Nesterenkonia sphaerica]
MTEPAVPPAQLPGQNWQLQKELADLEATASFARALAAELKSEDLVVLTGELGAGKTTFTRELAAALGVIGQVSSPTFTMSRIHPSPDGTAPRLVHVDAYRTDAAGLESLDLLATLPGSVTVVEWGRGMVERALLGDSGSWLDLELRQSPAESTAADGKPLSGGPAGGVVAGIQTDFSESEEDILGTRRLAVLRGYGPRWSAPPARLQRWG